MAATSELFEEAALKAMTMIAGREMAEARAREGKIPVRKWLELEGCNTPAIHRCRGWNKLLLLKGISLEHKKWNGTITAGQTQLKFGPIHVRAWPIKNVKIQAPKPDPHLR